MYDFIAIGDATMDVFMVIDDANVLCELDNQNCKLVLNYADKIAAKTAEFIIGGNAANAAVGARRLGLPSAFLTTVGGDDTGRKILDVMRREGVSTEFMTVDPEARSNFSVVINFQGERTILVHHEPRDYNWTLTSPPAWIYLTSMGEGFEPIYDRTIQLVKESQTRLAYNPGTHQLKRGLEYLKPSLAAADLLFLNREESAELLGVANHPSIEELLRGLKSLGPATVVITDGKNGSFAFDGQTDWQLGLFDGPVVERTGAGDAYGLAFTVAIAEGKSIDEAMLWGNANATSVVGQVGPEAGLLTQGGVAQIVAKNDAVRPQSRPLA